MSEIFIFFLKYIEYVFAMITRYDKFEGLDACPAEFYLPAGIRN